MPKKPEDHQPKHEPFVWQSPYGGEVRLTPFNKLPFGLFRKSRNMTDEDRTFAMLEAATDEAGLQIVDDLPTDEVDELFKSWAAASGVELPES